VVPSGRVGFQKSATATAVDLVRFVRCLLSLITMLVRRDLSKDAELLVISTYADTNASVACSMSTDMPRDMPG
jgi:hypothetical protein